MAAAVDQPVKPIPWWLVLVQGILAILLGAFFLMRPVQTSVIFVQVVAIFWLVGGVMDIIRIFMDSSGWGWKLFSGIIGIIAGLFLLGEGLLGAAMFGIAIAWVLGFLGIVYGVIYIIQFFKGAGWLSIVLGVLSIIFGIILLTNTLLTAATLPWVFGIFLIAGGIFAIIMAFKLR